MNYQVGVRRSLYVLAVMFFFLSQGYAQKTRNRGSEDGDGGKQKVFVTAGPEVNLILPTDFGSDNRGFYGDTMAIFKPSVSFRLGGNVRFDFSKRFSLQTGLYYVQRVYNVEIGIADADHNGMTTRLAQQRLTYTGFEIPVMGLIYVQLGRNWFMNNLVGFSADFFPSSVQDTAQGYRIYGGRYSWIVPSVKVAIGFEARTNNAGYFYLGGQFHRPLIPIFEGLVQKQDQAGSSLWGSNSVSADVSGTYFSIDFKYFLPPGKKNKFMDR